MLEGSEELQFTKSYALPPDCAPGQNSANKKKTPVVKRRKEKRKLLLCQSYNSLSVPKMKRKAIIAYRLYHGLHPFIHSTNLRDTVQELLPPHHNSLLIVCIANGNIK